MQSGVAAVRQVAETAQGYVDQAREVVGSAVNAVNSVAQLPGQFGRYVGINVPTLRIPASVDSLSGAATTSRASVDKAANGVMTLAKLL